jgi:hypothetical protein
MAYRPELSHKGMKVPRQCPMSALSLETSRRLRHRDMQEENGQIQFISVKY